MVSAELKPCPFCGGEAKVNTLKWVGGYTATALCKNEPNGHYLNTWDEDEVKAIERITKAWNTRAERTCENVGYYIDPTRFKCSACDYNGWVKYANGGDKVPRYCPNCGARVVEE